MRYPGRTGLGPSPIGETKGRRIRICLLGASKDVGEKGVYSWLSRREPGA